MGAVLETIYWLLIAAALFTMYRRAYTFAAILFSAATLIAVIQMIGD